jgi:hypothetical protein
MAIQVRAVRTQMPELPLRQSRTRCCACSSRREPGRAPRAALAPRHGKAQARQARRARRRRRRRRSGPESRRSARRRQAGPSISRPRPSVRNPPHAFLHQHVSAALPGVDQMRVRSRRDVIDEPPDHTERIDQPKWVPTAAVATGLPARGLLGGVTSVRYERMFREGDRKWLTSTNRRPVVKTPATHRRGVRAARRATDRAAVRSGTADLCGCAGGREGWRHEWGESCRG